MAEPFKQMLLHTLAPCQTCLGSRKALGSCLPGIYYDAPAREHGAIQREGLILTALSAHIAAILPAVPSIHIRKRAVHCRAAYLIISSDIWHALELLSRPYVRVI